jgi:hypothetical protein
MRQLLEKRDSVSSMRISQAFMFFSWCLRSLCIFATT